MQTSSTRARDRGDHAAHPVSIERRAVRRCIALPQNAELAHRRLREDIGRARPLSAVRHRTRAASHARRAVVDCVRTRLHLLLDARSRARATEALVAAETISTRA